MSMIIIKKKTGELKGLINEGLHVLGRAMSMCEELCEGSEYGERNMDYPYSDRMGMRDNYEYPEYPYMGERRGVRGTGRYSMYR